MRDPRLFVSYGRDPRAMVLELLDAAGVAAGVPGGLDGSRGVLLKPNLVVAKPAAAGATTHPEIVAGVIEFLQAHGVRGSRIRIAEGSWTGGDTRQAFRECGYEEISRRYGVALVDLKQVPEGTVSVEGHRLTVCRSLLEGDYFINLPVLKGHCQTGMTCALKNLKGCIPDREKHRFHREGLHALIALLNRAVPQDLIVVDGLCGDLSSEMGGNPVAMDRLILGRDPVLVDSYAAQVMGFRPQQIEYISRAAALGVGSMDTTTAEIVPLGTPRDAQDAQALGARRAGRAGRGKLQSLAGHIEDRQACSACYGNTLHALQRLEDEGLLADLRDPIHVGQGYRGRAHAGLGVGSCAAGSGRCAQGCPPTGREILDLLRAALR